MPLYDRLIGEWSFHRTIQDFRNPVSGGHAEGQAHWSSRSSSRLEYREEGFLHYGDYHENVTQTYLYDFDTPDCAIVRFSDERPFHWIDGLSQSCNFFHLCGDDRYNGVFTIAASGAITLRWMIRGPRKHQDILTKFIRD